MNPSQTATGDDPRNHDYRCSLCGYGIAIHTPPHACPICHSTTWEPSHPRPNTAAPTRRIAIHGPGRAVGGRTGQA